MAKETIGIAMSGGVDSTAAALLLREEYQVHGFFMELAQPDFETQFARVQEIAKRCNIPLTVIDLRTQFKAEVLDYFATSYRRGYTPNPCMICNPKIKFGLFMDAIIRHGMDKIATGHYAQIYEKDGCFLLGQGTDLRKDQSYFLARLSQQQLSRVLFPLGKMDKNDVYQLVEEHGFTSFRGQESQDVCFLGAESIGSFLEKEATMVPQTGAIVTSDGEVLGTHRGIYNYTIGQRKGLGISAPTPLYVIRIDAEKNQIVVGQNDDLFQKTVECKDLLWNCGKQADPSKHYRVRIRYGHMGGDAIIEHLPGNTCIAHFDTPQRAVTRGQFAVIYDQDQIIGSGEII